MRVYWVMGYARTHRRSVDGNSERRALRALGVNRSLKLYVAVAAGHRNRVFASESPNTPHPNTHCVLQLTGVLTAVIYEICAQ